MPLVPRAPRSRKTIVLTALIPCLFPLQLLGAVPCFAEEYILPPIIKDASPVDSLAEDPIVPSQESATGVSSGSGSIQQNLEDKLPYSVTDPGRPGSLTQFRGLGRSAEDTDVQTLGIPLNPPQGGGFDFTTFPQFLWSQYRLTLTPALSALDPRATAGTLSLVPWSAEALADADAASESAAANRWTALYAGAYLQQISIGTRYKDRFAVLAGNSSGLVSGPSGSASARLAGSDGEAASSWSVKAHLLATDIDAKTYNFGFGQSPEQTTLRLMPVIQLDASLGERVALKSSLFYDNSYIRYDDPSGNFFSRDRAQQYGIENAIFAGDWKLGAGSRMVNYQITGFNAPAENMTNGMLARTLSWQTGQESEFLLDPVLQGVYVSHFDFAPQASLGIREQWEDSAVYSRASYSRLFPTLADLYYSVPAVGSGNAIQGNPALMPEDDFTYVLGAEGGNGIWRGSIELYYQIRDNAQVLVLSAPGTDQQRNVGQARLASLVASSSYQLTGSAKIMDSVHFTDSRVDALQSSYPYMPDVLNILGVEMSPMAHCVLSADTRVASSQFVDSSGGLPSTAFTDIQAEYEFSSRLRLVGRAENVTGDDLVLEKGYAPKNRVLVVSAVGAF